MAESPGVELPPRMKPARIGDRWLGVIPIAQAAVINDDVIVQLVALERHDNGAVLTVRISRLEEMILTEPRDGIPWPRLDLTARDDVGTEYRIDGGSGAGSQSDWDVGFGLSGRIPQSAHHLNVTVTELRWEDLSSGLVERRTAGEWTFAIDLSRELLARLV